MKPLYQRVEDMVNTLPEVSVTEAMGYLRRTIDASQAITAGRRVTKKNAKVRKVTLQTLDQLAERGRRHIIGSALSRLYKLGRIRKLRMGVYAALLPKIFNEGKAG